MLTYINTRVKNDRIFIKITKLDSNIIYRDDQK